jgi:heme exporter protein D
MDTPEQQEVKDHAGTLNPVEAYRRQISNWKRVTLMLAAALIVMASLGVYSITQNRRTLQILEKATGPEAQEQQGQVVEGLVFRIECDHREVLQQVLDEMVPSRGVTIVTDECKENSE